MSGRGHTLLTIAGGHSLLTTSGGQTQGAKLDLLTTVDVDPTLDLPILTVNHLLASMISLTLLMIQGTTTILSLEACHLGQEGQGGATHAVSHPGLRRALGGATHAVFP